MALLGFNVIDFDLILFYLIWCFKPAQTFPRLELTGRHFAISFKTSCKTNKIRATARRLLVLIDIVVQFYDRVLVLREVFLFDKY